MSVDDKVGQAILNFDPGKLSKEDKESYDFVKRRIVDLKDAREHQYGTELEKVWSDADQDYVPHRFKTKGKRVIATDDLLGWRGTLVTLGASDWQSDISMSNPYVKIQTALAILIDQNPKGVFTPTSKKYQQTTALMEQLYNRSWDYAKSRQQLKLFVFNLAKYGWACARTYPLRISRKVKNLVSYDQESPEKSKYEEKEVVEFNDIFRENLDPWNVWPDDMAEPNNRFSMRDWAWRKVYPLDAFKEEFGNWSNAKFVKPGGITVDRVVGPRAAEKRYKEKDLVEVFFYENRLRDLFVVIANNVPVIIEPLPISDSVGNKKLSLWQTYWTLRHPKMLYGIGIYEAIRNEQALLDRIRNMTIDQLTLSIYKMFFFQGTQALTETGDIRITPGLGKQVLDPKNINWLEVPGPGKDAYEGLGLFKKDLDDVSGITETLMGTITGKTAFEIAQAKEAALKRLKTPLDNITDALETEAYVTISLIQLLYSIPETFKVTDQTLIEDYLKEIESDPELYERDDSGNFIAKVFPEFPLNLDKDEEGNLIQTEDTRFFRVKPRFLKWEGIVNVKPQSVLTPSKQIDKALDLEMYNMVIPLIAQPPQLYAKIAKSIVKLYDKDPRDILPDDWLKEEPPLQSQQVIIPVQPRSQPGEPFVASGTKIPQQPKGVGQRIVSKFTKPARKI